MTTIAYRNSILVSDGQVSFGERIDQMNLKKVRKINGCLVGGAGRLTSVLQFFSWFEGWSDAQLVQGEAPHVQVFIPEGLEDEDFTGLVVFTDGVVFMYEGGKRSYELVNSEYYAIGSGADFALSAMDAGATAEEAVKVAIKRDVFSGGEIFVEELDEEPEELTKEKAAEMSKEELLKFMFGEENPNEELKEDFVDNDEPLVDTEHYTIFEDGFVYLYFSENPSVADALISDINEKEGSIEELTSILKSGLQKLVFILTGAVASPKANKVSLSRVVYDALFDIWKEKNK